MAATKAIAGAGSTGQPAVAERSTVNTSVAPRPAPAAAPRRYGSTSGLRNTPLVAGSGEGERRRRRSPRASPAGSGCPTRSSTRCPSSHCRSRSSGRRSRSSSGTCHHSGPAGPIDRTEKHGDDDGCRADRHPRRPPLRWRRRRRRQRVPQPPLGTRAFVIASATDLGVVDDRGPQRDAMSSSIAITLPLTTALSPSHPGRAATVSTVLAAALRVGEEDQVRIARR